MTLDPLLLTSICWFFGFTAVLWYASFYISYGHRVFCMAPVFTLFLIANFEGSFLYYGYWTATPWLILQIIWLVSAILFVPVIILLSRKT